MGRGQALFQDDDTKRGREAFLVCSGRAPQNRADRDDARRQQRSCDPRLVLSGKPCEVFSRRVGDDDRPVHRVDLRDLRTCRYVSLAFVNSHQFRFAGLVCGLVDGGDGDRAGRGVEFQSIAGLNSGLPLHACRDS